jgi:hypothetical protein
MISPQSQNPYVYCMNNPLRYIDPNGMMLTDTCINADREAAEAQEQALNLPSGPPMIDPVIDAIREALDPIINGGANSGSTPSNNDNNPHDDAGYYDTSNPGQDWWNRENPQSERGEVNGIRRDTVQGSVLVGSLTLEWLHDLHKGKEDKTAFRLVGGACTSVSKGGGLVGTVGTVKEESIDTYLNNNGWASGGVAYHGGINVFFNSENEVYGGEAIIFGSTVGVSYNTPEDLLIAQYYEGQFTSDIPGMESVGNYILHLLGVI